MSRALRGDFERLRERGVSTTLTQPEPLAPPAETETPAAEPPATTPADDAGDAPRAGLLSRLLGR